MTYRKYLVSIIGVAFAGSMGAMAQSPVMTPPSQHTVVTQAPSAARRAALAPTDTDIYCSGFYSHRQIDTSFNVLGGPDSGLTFEHPAGDTVYLNKGSEFLKAPGGDYLLLRPMRDLSPVESFPGQRRLVAGMGTLYAEIARIRIEVVQKDSSVAEVLKTCEPVLAGDIAVPLTQRPIPAYKQARITDRYTPSSGKATGVLAGIKGYQESAGGDSIVYLNLGQSKGLQPGSYLRIFRTYSSASQFLYRDGASNYIKDMDGVPVGRKLTPDEIDTLPRVVVGEAMVLSAESDTATAIVTYSWEDLYPGDEVELE